MQKDIYVLIHNIRSLYNVGSIFRTSDGAKIKKIYISGYTGTPPQKEISKTAINATNFIEWEYIKDPMVIIKKLKMRDVQIIALEQHKNSINYKYFKTERSICIVVGNEITGISNDILKECDSILEIPMYGKKTSLNVSVAFGICVYKLRENI